MTLDGQRGCLNGGSLVVHVNVLAVAIHAGRPCFGPTVTLVVTAWHGYSTYGVLTELADSECRPSIPAVLASSNMASPEVARPSPPAVRRKRRKPHHVLGDVHEFEANLRAAERAPTPPPVEESFDLHALPSDVTAAMEVCSTSYQPLLDAYKELHRERCSLQSQHEKIQDLRAAGGDATTLPPTLTAALAATRDNRCANPDPSI